MLNAFGQWLRKFRIDKGLLLKDMANTLGISSAFLSAMETGRKSIPNGFADKICESYQLDNTLRGALTDAIEKSKRKVQLDLSDTTVEAQGLALAFAKRFSSLSKTDREEILKILEKAGDVNVQ